MGQREKLNNDTIAMISANPMRSWDNPQRCSELRLGAKPLDSCINLALDTAVVHNAGRGTNFSPWGHLAMSGDIFNYCNWRRGIYWAETRDAATHPQTHRTVPTTEKYHPKVSEPLRFLKDKGCSWRVLLILGKVASSS